MTPDWVRQACARLELSDESTIVLVRGAAAHHLRPAALGLNQALGRPGIAFCVADFVHLKPGSVALVSIRREELPRLNEVRPVAQQRGLKLLLMPLDSQGGVAAARNDAPDFLDWASHVVEAESELATVVRAGVEAARGVLPGVSWQGPPLREVLEALGVSFQSISATQPHRALNDALAESDAEAIIWTHAATRYERRRIEWVLALAAQRPRLSMTEGQTVSTTWPVVDARTSEPWALLKEGRSNWDVALTGCATLGSVDPEDLISVAQRSQPLPAMTGLDAARQAFGEKHLDTAEFVLRNSSDEDPILEARMLLERGDVTTAKEMLEHSVGNDAAPETEGGRQQALGNVYLREGRLDEAQQAFREAFSAYETAYGKADPRSAAALHGLGTVFDNQHEYAEAERTYRRVLELLDGASNPHLGIPAALQGLGNIYERQGRYEEAQRAFQEALDVSEDFYGKTDNPTAAAPLHGLGSVYTLQGRYAEAERAFTRSLEMLSGREPEPSSALTSRRLGDVYVAQGKYAEAEDAYRRALRTLEAIHKTTEHPSRFAALQGLGNVFNRQGRYAEANRAVAEATRLSASPTKE